MLGYLKKHYNASFIFPSFFPSPSSSFFLLSYGQLTGNNQSEIIGILIIYQLLIKILGDLIEILYLPFIFFIDIQTVIFWEKRFPILQPLAMIWSLKFASLCTLINIQALSEDFDHILRPFFLLCLKLLQLCPLLACSFDPFSVSHT